MHMWLVHVSCNVAHPKPLVMHLFSYLMTILGKKHVSITIYTLRGVCDHVFLHNETDSVTADAVYHHCMHDHQHAISG